MSRAARRAFALLVLAIAGESFESACAAAAPRRVDTARIAAAWDEPRNWLSHGGSYAEARYSPLAMIDATNVGSLGLAWFHDFDTNRGQESTPLVVDGVMFVTTAWSKVYALDAATGQEIWYYDPKVPGHFGGRACCDVVNRGAAFYDGRVYVGTLDGRLIALDARTGRLAWSANTVDGVQSYSITGAPRVARGKVFIGNGGAAFGVRGYVSAYDARTGRLAWRFYTVPGNPAKPDHAASDAPLERIARPTWHGSDYYKYGGGGTVWDSIVYDPELNHLYIGVGSGSPWNRAIRSGDRGDNLFLSAIVALDPDTGRYLWHYQETPGDTWGYAASQQMILATLALDGVPRKVILHAPKNGFFYVIDRARGKLLSAAKFAPVNWAERVDPGTGRPVENPDARYLDKPFLATSGVMGAHNWFPMSYSPRTALVYLPEQQVPFLYRQDSHFEFNPGQWNVGVDMAGTRLPLDAAGREAMHSALQGGMIAWDPIARREVWRVRHAGPGNGGTLATGGDLVFEGTASGRFQAYRARTGERVWDFDAQTAVLAGPISYAVRGEQYVAVVAGDGGGLPLTLPAFGGPRLQPPGRVLVFRLGGTARLPHLDAKPPAANVPTEAWSVTAVEKGRILYARHCATCHGVETLSAGILPDLRRTSLLTEKAAWHRVVLDGALSNRGMISFRDQLDADGVEAIRAYVGSEARTAEAREGTLH